MKGFFRKIFGGSEAVEIRNRAILTCLRDADIAPAEIRKALLVINKVPIGRFANGTASKSMVYSTIKGTRKDPKIMQLVASELGLNVEDIFPESKPIVM